MKSTNLGEANKKLSKSEYNLYLSTEPDHIKDLSEKQLKAKISRLDKKIEKLKTLKMTSARSRKAQALDTDAKTASKKLKVRYFTEARKRLKGELKSTQVRTQEAKKAAAKRPVSKKKNTNARLVKASKRGVVLKVKPHMDEQKTRVNSKGSKFTSKKRSAHAGGKNKRFQGKKDSRG